jgi:hypothetical protein
MEWLNICNTAMEEAAHKITPIYKDQANKGQAQAKG